MDLTIFMPCAGLGTRLRPLTSRIPKPMVPFQGKSAFKINWEKLIKLDPKKIICNSHYLPEPIHIEARGLGIEIVHEEKILGTGGCLANLKNALVQTEYFLVHNADILHNISLNNFIQNSLDSDSIGDIAGVPNSEINTLSVKPDGILAGIKNINAFKPDPGHNSLTFTGIALYRADILKYCTRMPDDLINIWLRGMSRGETIRVHNYSESAWFDFGEPRGLWQAAKWMMEQTGNFSFQYKGTDKNPCVSNETNLDLNDIELKNALILEAPHDNSEPGKSGHITGKDFSWPVE